MDNREVALLGLAGGVLPVVTVLGVFSATARYELPWFVPLILLLVTPLFGAVGLYRAGIRLGSLRTPSWLPVGTRRTFGDEIPERYHEEFSPGTLDESTAVVDEPSGRAFALGVIYLVSVPVYTVVLWLLFS